MSQGGDEEPMARLTEVQERTFSPFVRASTVEDASVYWMPVTRYPMLPQPREWLLEFHKRLAKVLGKQELREECFLQFKSLYPDLIDRFTATSGEYMPMTGASLVPGHAPQPLPSFDAIKEQVEHATKSGTPVDTTRWMPDHLQWFLKKYPDRQRNDFLGHGGMLTLYVAKDPTMAPPAIEVPRYVRTNPGFDEDEMKSQMTAVYSLRDAFLAKSKERFGEPFQSDPSYKGLMFVLPLFTSETLVQSTPEQRAAWFDVFDGYLMESKVDRGVLLAIKQPDFDETLIALVEGLRDDGLVYRL